MSRNIFANDGDALRAICVMESTRPAGWEDLKKSITRRISALSLESCITRDETQSRWNQGRVQELYDLLDSFSTAREVYDKQKSPHKNSLAEGY